MNLLYLKELGEEDLTLLKSIPALVTILIGGADDQLDAKEIAMGKTSTEYRKNNGEVMVHDYFEWVSHNFEEIFDEQWKTYQSYSVEERTNKISSKIAEANSILNKIDKKYAHALVVSWRGLARAVANSSGGILGRLSIASEEKDLIGLDMLQIQ